MLKLTEMQMKLLFFETGMLFGHFNVYGGLGIVTAMLLIGLLEGDFRKTTTQ